MRIVNRFISFYQSSSISYQFTTISIQYPHMFIFTDHIDDNKTALHVRIPIQRLKRISVLPYLPISSLHPVTQKEKNRRAHAKLHQPIHFLHLLNSWLPTTLITDKRNLPQCGIHQYLDHSDNLSSPFPDANIAFSFAA